jgi:hypothetical protein
MVRRWIYSSAGRRGGDLFEERDGEMSHHSSEPLSVEIEAFLNGLPINKAASFPEGKLTETDEGATGIAISHHENKVLVHFGKPIVWIGFTKKEALLLVDSILKHASECKESK